jgi:SAM-dependent methyltransferase
VRERVTRRVKAATPWYLKVGVKLALSPLPVSRGRLSQRLGIFKFGEMTDPAYACEVFAKHATRAGVRDGFRTLELGPGDSLATAVIARAWGGEGTVLVDEDAVATDDVGFYRRLVEHLAAQGLRPPDLSGVETRAEVLERCNAVYLTEGLASLRKLPSGSVDFVFSNAVLEHVRAEDFEPTMRELRRILTSTGRASHTIDLRDHLDEALNHMRFSRSRWESPAFAKSGFYTNRLTYRELLDCFAGVGFSVEDATCTRWSSLPTPREKLAEPFRHHSDEVLTVSGLDVVLAQAESGDPAAVV